ncbi:unnamed protein product [Amoebophrya sp. A120]|nr:unnamed protein product [Amoebophrya sp. A120]|eukprot:GSA120T00005364001.1
MGKHTKKTKLTKSEKREKLQQEQMQKIKELQELEQRVQYLYIQNKKIEARIARYQRYYWSSSCLLGQEPNLAFFSVCGMFTNTKNRKIFFQDEASFRLLGGASAADGRRQTGSVQALRTGVFSLDLRRHSGRFGVKNQGGRGAAAAADKHQAAI